MFKRCKLLFSIAVVGLIVTSFTVTSGASSYENNDTTYDLMEKDGINKEAYEWIISCFDSFGITWENVGDKNTTPVGKDYAKLNDQEQEHNEWRQKDQGESGVWTPNEEQTIVEEWDTTDNKKESLNNFEREVVQLTNVEREAAGLAPLQIDESLSNVAREKSRDMLENNYFDHQSPTYGSPFDMIKGAGITYRTAGENIAMGQRSPEEVVNAWMNSPGHRANILNGNYTHIGVGYIEQGNYWTQQFIGK